MRHTGVDEALTVSWDVTLLRDGLLEVEYGLTQRDRDAQLQLAGPCYSLT